MGTQARRQGRGLAGAGIRDATASHNVHKPGLLLSNIMDLESHDVTHVRCYNTIVSQERLWDTVPSIDTIWSYKDVCATTM